MDQLQVTLKARDELTNEVKRATKEMAKLEAAIKEATQAGSPQAAQQVDKLERKLATAQTRAQRSTAAVGQLDQKIEQLGGSAGETARDLDKMNREAGRGSSSVAKFKGSAAKASVATAALAAAAVGLGVAVKRAAELTWQASQAAAAYEKKVRRTDIVFGRQAKSVRAWADANNEAFGASVEDVASYLAGVGDILKPLGFTTKEASNLTLGVGELIPALAEWNTVGMDAAQVSYALTSAMTGEREMLKSLGIVIMEEDVKAKVAAMEAAGEFTTETEKQREAIATLKLSIEGSSDALKSYSGNSASAGRALALIRAKVAEVRDAGLDIIGESIRRVARSMDMLGDADGKNQALDWMMENREVLIDSLISVASLTTKTAAAFFRLNQGLAYLVGDTLRAFGSMLSIMPGKVGEFGDSMVETGENLNASGDAMGDMSTKLNRLGDQILSAKGKTDRFITSLQSLREAGASQAVVDASRNIPIAGDTAAPMGSGHLGAAGLAAAHAGFASQLGGHSITSGVRSWGLGSANSDHLHGRAMDITGPRMGAYAQIVRRSGGYAAMHGAGANRHLHVVPKTRRPAPSGGNTFRADVTVVNPQSEMDIQASVARGLRAAARQDSERS